MYAFTAIIAYLLQMSENIVHTEFSWIETAASIIFSEEKMRPIIKGGLYSRAAFIALAVTPRKVK